jgi:hypothetical protein
MTIRSKERKVNELHFVNIFSLLETSLEWLKLFICIVYEEEINLH